ncbi:MAG: hypothetical protein C0615_05315 [Desulfuromonas sp.]|nr:MAG: hypothetical protein C0615_05315 [Desulfuromonas sp.]
MMDRFTKAVEELQEKSPFICTSCGHPHKIAGAKKHTMQKPADSVHDRFSEATREEGEKSAFVCESCGHKQELPKKNLH